MKTAMSVNPVCLTGEGVNTNSNGIGCIIRRNGILYQIPYYPFEANVTSGVANAATLDLMNGRTVKSREVIRLLEKHKVPKVIERLCSCNQNKKTVNAALAFLALKGHIKVLTAPRIEKRGRKRKQIYQPGIINAEDNFIPTESVVNKHYLEYELESKILSETIDR